MTIGGPEDFVKILKENSKLVDVIPWGQELINLQEGLNSGCKCSKGKRARWRDETYKEMVNLVLANNSTLRDFMKKELSGKQIIFMYDNKELLKF